jgi:hypothetical protein
MSEADYLLLLDLNENGALREKLTDPRFCGFSAKRRSWFGVKVQTAQTLGEPIVTAVSRDPDLWNGARVRTAVGAVDLPAVTPC